MKRVAILLLAALLCLAACAPKEETPDSTQAITLTGLGEEIQLTARELKALPAIETEAFTHDSKNRERTNQVKGVLLDEVLRPHGKTQADFAALTVSSDDGYQVSIPNDVLVARRVIIAYEMDGYAIPLRLCVPEERTMYWVKNLSQLDFSSNQEAQVCTKVIILETAVASLETVDFPYNANTDKAVKIRDLAEKYFVPSAEFVSIMAKDGLSPTMTWEAFLDNLLKLDGDAAPLLGRPDSIGAMSIKGFKYALCGDTALIFVGDGTTVKDILDILSIPVSGNFILTGEDGRTVVISAAETAGVGIVISKDGTAEANGMVGLLSIEVHG